jgi:hypothetical protein
MARLRQVPANRWPRYWQDAAFSTVHNWEYAGSGARTGTGGAGNASRTGGGLRRNRRGG